MKVPINLMLLLLLALTSCKEFLEPSLEHRSLSLLAPSEQLETNLYKQVFWWSALEDAIYYRLQVVSPNFNNISSLVLDTLVRGDKFTYSLEPGKYQWRVRAENGSSQSSYFSRSFEVFPSSLSNQVLQILTPASGVLITDATVRYDWLKLFGATRYRLQVDTNSFADSSKLVINTLTDNLSYIQQLQREGKYEFRARAENDSQVSKWSTLRSFIFDQTAPEKVVLSSPANKQRVSLPTQLKWIGNTDVEKYEVSVYRTDSVTLITGYPVLQINNTATFSAGSPGEQILWRIRGIDKAGNKGDYSNYFSFTIN